MKKLMIGATCALSVLAGSVGAQAAEPALGSVTNSNNTLILREGKLLPAAAGVPLYSGDRVVTRGGGSAKLALGTKCAVTLGASAMVSVGATACAKQDAASLGDGRSGYSGGSSAFAPELSTGLIVGGVVAGGALVGALALSGGDGGGDDDGDGSPASP